MPDYTLIETTLSDKRDILAPLLRQHAAELGAGSALKSAAPNWEAYRALENTGSLLAVVAYAGEQIVGYATVFIGAHLHHVGLRYAHSDALYVLPTHRRGGLGLSLIRETERLAKEGGARLIMWHAKPDSALEKILPRIGYGVEETAYCKEI